MSWARPPASGLRRKKQAEKYSTLSDESTSGEAPLTVSRSRERKRVSCVKKPLISSTMSPRSSQMQNVAPSRTVSGTRSLLRPQDAPARRLGERLHDELVHVDAQRTGQREEHAFGDVIRDHGLHACVHGTRLLGVAAE